MIPFAVPPIDNPRFAAGRNGVHALIFFVAAIQTGFGPFISVWLVSRGWSLTDVGIALSVNTVAGLCAQIPCGFLVDATGRKRDITAIALAVISISAIMIAVVPSMLAIYFAQVLHSFGSAILTPAIAALTLSLCGPEGFSDRLGGNARFAALGAAIAAAVFGVASSDLGEQSIFFITAALAVPAAASLLYIKPGCYVPSPSEHMGIAPMEAQPTKAWEIFKLPAMNVFALSVLLFQLCNAGMLPLAVGELSIHGQAASYIVPAAIIVPQLIAAACSPWAGALARAIGRRPVLLAGFIVLPLRAVLFAFNPAPEALDFIQVLDGVGATVLGLMIPLIAADLTRKKGHLNLAIGSFDLASGLGATLSTTFAGWAADRLGAQNAFLGLALVGGAAIVLLALAMPETRPKLKKSKSQAAA